MRFVLFCHSLLSDWNHGNAHFLRGIVTELQARGHVVTVFEPEDAWSLKNLLADSGDLAVRQFGKAYPHLSSIRYKPGSFDAAAAVKNADVVIVHEWNDHQLVKALGKARKNGRFRLLFHDTHHRSVTDRTAMERYDLAGFDGVLAYGSIIRDIYLREGWARRAWTWHEAADVRVFQPLDTPRIEGDLVWVGNWGDEERTEELEEFLIRPVEKLRLRATVYGVRYPQAALQRLARAGIRYGGWLPNFHVPKVFARYRVTVHVPRRPYVRQLPGIPTIRPFESMACGIPLVSSPWLDSERLFNVGRDFLMVAGGTEMVEVLGNLLADSAMRRRLADHGRKTILERHTCSHRVDELMQICRELGLPEEETTSVRRDAWQR